MNWPHHFEVTARIAAVHESVFAASQVWFFKLWAIFVQCDPQRAVDALYSDGLMTSFYAENSQVSHVSVEVSKVFSAVLESLRRGGKKFIKILEVGAGQNSRINTTRRKIKAFQGLGY
jgi:hypothetical protein